MLNDKGSEACVAGELTSLHREIPENPFGPVRVFRFNEQVEVSDLAFEEEVAYGAADCVDRDPCGSRASEKRVHDLADRRRQARQQHARVYARHLLIDGATATAAPGVMSFDGLTEVSPTDVGVDLRRRKVRVT